MRISRGRLKKRFEGDGGTLVIPVLTIAYAI